MGMSVGGGGGDDAPMMEINTTPLIDIMLVLLIMLIITIPIQTHAVKLDMPPPPKNPPPEPPVPPEVVELVVDFDGTVYWNGNAVPGRETLKSYFAQAAAKDVQPEIHLRPDRLAKYEKVAVVLGDAQRLGVTKIGFVGNEQYLQ